MPYSYIYSKIAPSLYFTLVESPCGLKVITRNTFHGNPWPGGEHKQIDITSRDKFDRTPRQ